MVFFVVALKTRAVEVAGIASNPDVKWMQQMARNLTDKSVVPALPHFARVLRPVLALQLVATPGVRRRLDNGDLQGYVISADRFLPLLP